MNIDDAEEFTQALGQIVAGSWRQIALGVRLDVPATLGLGTREWVEQRLGGYVRLSIGERREAVAELVAEGMTQRDAADVVGVHEATVSRDLADASDDADKAAEEAAELAPASGRAAHRREEEEQRQSVQDMLAAAGEQSPKVAAAVALADDAQALRRLDAVLKEGFSLLNARTAVRAALGRAELADLDRYEADCPLLIEALQGVIDDVAAARCRGLEVVR